MCEHNTHLVDRVWHQQCPSPPCGSRAHGCVLLGSDVPIFVRPAAAPMKWDWPPRVRGHFMGAALQMSESYTREKGIKHTQWLRHCVFLGHPRLNPGHPIGHPCRISFFSETLYIYSKIIEPFKEVYAKGPLPYLWVQLPVNEAFPHSNWPRPTLNLPWMMFDSAI